MSNEENSEPIRLLPLVKTMKEVADILGVEITEHDILAPTLSLAQEADDDMGPVFDANLFASVVSRVFPPSSSYELKVKRIVDSLNIYYEFRSYGPIYPKQLDFYFPKLGKAIEVNSTSFHADEEREIYKRSLAKEVGIALAYVWDVDLNRNYSATETAIREFLSASNTPMPKLFSRTTPPVRAVIGHTRVSDKSAAKLYAQAHEVKERHSAGNCQPKSQRSTCDCVRRYETLRQRYLAIKQQLDEE